MKEINVNTESKKYLIEFMLNINSVVGELVYEHNKKADEMSSISDELLGENHTIIQILENNL